MGLRAWVIADTSDVGVEKRKFKKRKVLGEDCGVNREKRDCRTKLSKTKCVWNIHMETYYFVI